MIEKIQYIKELSRLSMYLLCIASLLAADEPLIDLAHEAAIDAQEQAEHLEKMNEAWRKECEGAAARGFVFRVVDQSGNPAAGVAVALSTTHWNPGVTVDSASGTTTWLEAVTDADGLARLRSPLGHVFSASLVAYKLDDDRWALANANEEPPVVQFEGSPEAVAAGIPVDRRPAGVDYEFRVIRYPSPAPVVYWESQLLLKPDGRPQAWNPLAQVLLPLKTSANRQPVDVPGDWPAEWEVRLWRDPAIPPYTLGETKTPSGRVYPLQIRAKDRWSCSIRVLGPGGGLLAPWKAQQQDGRDWFPINNTLPLEGYQPEIAWNHDETTEQGPSAWNQTVAWYWRRQERQFIQVWITPFCRERPAQPGRMPPDLPTVDDLEFGISCSFRLRPDGERQIVLPINAIPTVGGIRDASDRPQPTWYRWATRDQLAEWLAPPAVKAAEPDAP